MPIINQKQNKKVNIDQNIRYNEVSKNQIQTATFRQLS